MKKTLLLAIAAVLLLSTISYAGTTWSERRYRERQKEIAQKHRLERETQRSDKWQIDDMNSQISELEFYKNQATSALDRDRYYRQIQQLKAKRNRLERKMNKRSQ